MIPHYQQPSLQGENVAKRRIMKKAKEAFEGEEQRAIKSGQVIDELKTAYKTIVANLQLQLLTMNLTKSAVESIIAAASSGGLALYPATDDDSARMSDENSDFKVAQGSLHSLLIGSLGKLVGLSNQLRILCGNLSDKTKESGKPVTGSADLSKINSLFVDVDRAFGAYSEEGLSKGLGQMLDELRMVGGRGVPQVERLTELYVRNMFEAHEIIEKLQRNEYSADLKSVLIPSTSTDPTRRAGIASGSERREFTGEEYKLLVQLREQGLLQDDDFTSVYEGRDDDSSIASSRSGSSRSSRSSGRVFRPDRYVPRYSRRGYEKEGDSDTSSDEGARLVEGSDSDDDTLSTGSGLYSIPPSHRFPQRIF